MPQLDRQELVDGLQADKLSITHELGIQVRDLRILDPAMATSYPSAVLCREKALLVNLEHIKCIITTSYLLLLNADQPSVLQFAEDVKYRLANPSQPRPAKANPPKAKPKSKVGNLLRPSKSDTDLETYLLINGSHPSDSSSMSSGPDRELPFELKVTETVLDTVSHISASLPYCTLNNRKTERALLDVLVALNDTDEQAIMIPVLCHSLPQQLISAHHTAVSALKAAWPAASVSISCPTVTKCVRCRYVSSLPA